MNSDGTGVTNLTTYSDADERDPGWSPDGARIVFQSDLDQDQWVKDPSPMQRGVFVMNLDGTGLQKLTDNAQDNLDPTWSPDSSMIAFATFKDKDAPSSDGTPTWQITVVSAYGGNPNVITSVSGRTIDNLRSIAAWR